MTQSMTSSRGRALAAISLFASLLFALLLMPLVHLSQKLNAHLLHIPWDTYIPLYWSLVVVFLAISLIGSAVLLLRTRNVSSGRLRDSAYYSLLITAIGSLLFVFSVGTGHDWRLVHRYGALRRLEGIHFTIDGYKSTHDGQWPGDFATFVNDLHILNYSRDQDNLDMGLAFTEIEAYSDYAYFGHDLTDSPELKKEGRHILVFLGKVDLPEIPEVVLDPERNEYQYLFPGRPAIFANGQTRVILTRDLDTVLARHNAARARLGLGAQSVCE